MTEAEVAEIIAKALKKPSFDVIEYSQQDFGYIPNGFDPKSISIEKFDKGKVYRPTPEEGYPAVTSLFETTVQ